MNREFLGALNELEKERGISKEIVLDALEAALVSSHTRKLFFCSERARRNLP